MRKPLTPMPEAERIAALARMGLDADAIPLNATPQEKEAAMNPGLPAVSPTGQPLIPATGLFLKVATILVAIAAVVAVSDFFPATGWDEKIASLVLAGGAMLGIASPGVRKAAP